MPLLGEMEYYHTVCSAYHLRSSNRRYGSQSASPQCVYSRLSQHFAIQTPPGNLIQVLMLKETKSVGICPRLPYPLFNQSGLESALRKKSLRLASLRTATWSYHSAVRQCPEVLQSDF